MTQGAVLFLEPRQLLKEEHCPGVGNIQARERLLCRSGIQGILGDGNGISAAAGGEDFAHVIQRLAPGVGGTESQLLEQIVRAELQLQTVVVGEGEVVAVAENAEIAVHTAYSLRHYRVRYRAR